MSAFRFQSNLNKTHANTASSEARVLHNFEKAASRKDRLAIALNLLAQGGVTGNYAYAPAFRGLARAGLIIKPLHYWSFLGLTLFTAILFCVLAALTIIASLLLGVMPRPVFRMIEAGPVVFFAGNIALSMIFAFIHRFKAKQIGLPKWRDL